MSRYSETVTTSVYDEAITEQVLDTFKIWSQ